VFPDTAEDLLKSIISGNLLVPLLVDQEQSDEQQRATTFRFQKQMDLGPGSGNWQLIFKYFLRLEMRVHGGCVWLRLSVRAAGEAFRSILDALNPFFSI
jgi:hypothetical protein